MKTQTAKHLITLCVSDWPEEHAKVEFICKAVNEHDTLIAQRDALLEALRDTKDLLGHSDVRFKICDGGRGNLGEQSLYYRTIEKARKAIALCEPKEKDDDAFPINNDVSSDFYDR